MKRNLIVGVIAVILLAISIKYFPNHCNCIARTAGVGETSASTTAATTPLVPASTKTDAIYLNPTVLVGTTPITVDVADTPALREQGLSGRRELNGDTGMLFIFPSATRPGFWMKDMNFPIDIVWISADKRVVGVEKRVSPGTYPQAFYPPAAVLYVLELPAGYYDAHRFYTGESVTLHL